MPAQGEEEFEVFISSHAKTAVDYSEHAPPPPTRTRTRGVTTVKTGLNRLQTNAKRTIPPIGALINQSVVCWSPKKNTSTSTNAAEDEFDEHHRLRRNFPYPSNDNDFESQSNSTMANSRFSNDNNNQQQLVVRPITRSRTVQTNQTSALSLTSNNSFDSDQLSIFTRRKTAPTIAPIVWASKHLLQPNGSILGKHVATEMLPQFPDLLSCIPFVNFEYGRVHRNALASVDGRAPISHRRIYDFIVDMGLILHDQVRVGRGHRVAVVIPNGSELALAILSVTCWASCVPLNAFAAAAELESDLRKCGADCIIGLDPVHAPNAGPEIQQLAAKLQIPFVGLLPDKNFAGLFELYPPPTSKQMKDSFGKRDYFLPCKSNNNVRTHRMPNQHSDEIMVLFTSGTTGAKKLVTHLLSDVLVATACICLSWDLTPNHTNCNLMPLFHVGGIIRQVFSPVLSGGCVICCPSFDPLVFWKLLMTSKNSGTNGNNNTGEGMFDWYYAAPTMHQLILQTGRDEGYLLPYDETKEGRPFHEIRQVGQAKLKMIANAAGGLLPSLARELRQAFGANVLPSYGMTECMPISSPPASYQLDRPGTSGVAVGPELAILNKSTLQPYEFGDEGPICVRSEPCFRGYSALCDGENGPSSEKPVTFIPDPATGLSSGWFDTGDLGYMDSDGYLYITGRSKEVINRGGEIISPMEVEEAIIGHPDIEACAAFSTPHDLLQEVVGIVIVLKKGSQRMDLPTLHHYIGAGRLAAPKWPQCLVYMDGGLPKSFTNKLLRVGLGKRLSLPEMSDELLPIERTFNAECPPQGTDLSVPIKCEPVRANAADVERILRKSLVTDTSLYELVVVDHPSKPGSLVAHVYNLDRVHVIETARELLDAYAVPTHVCLLTSRVHSAPKYHTAPQSSDAVGAIIAAANNDGDSDGAEGTSDKVLTDIQELMQTMLKLDCAPSPTISFFNLGGSSMVASQLASKVRKLFGVSFGGSEVFQHSTCFAIASLVHERRGTTFNNVGNATGKIKLNNQAAGQANSDTKKQHKRSASTSKDRQINTHSVLVDDFTTSPFGTVKNSPPFANHRLEAEPGLFGALFQLVPLLIIYPMWQLTRVFLFFVALITVLNNGSQQYVFVKFLVTLFVFHFVWVTLTPLFFVLCKWVIIGQYRAGRYPLFGSYYLRWWFVDMLRKMIGRGTWGCTNFTLNLYYWLLGADIGWGVNISTAADLAEYDLITVGSDACIEISTVRAFGLDNGAMILGPVTIGSNASVGARSVVAPYTSVPDDTHLGPVASSYELIRVDDEDHDNEPSRHLTYNRQSLPNPSMFSQIFFIGPIMIFVSAVSKMPGWSIVYLLLIQPWNYERPYETMEQMIKWLSDPRRIPFYVGIRIAHSIISPFVYMTLAILIKWFVIGKFRPGPRDVNSEWQLIRHTLASSLFTRDRIQNVTELVGRHYELVSILYRLLGAKVGKRVFWPGRQPITTGEFDLLEIGDDVVFGSRTCMFFTTTTSAEKIVLCAGANVSDNSVVLPGSVVGKNAVLASNTICPVGRYLPEGSVWLGNKNGQPVMLEMGVEDYSGPAFASDTHPKKLQMIGDDTTIKPFGKAFYQRKANYFVVPLCFIVPYTIFIRVIASSMKALPIIGALHATTIVLYGWRFFERDYFKPMFSLDYLFPMLVGFFIITHFIHTSIWLAFENIFKWSFMGRRSVGRYNYDASSYGQRWELYQITSKLRDLGKMSFLDFLCGTPYMVAFFRSLGGTIGKNVCLYPTGGDPYMPEPDLVTIGDNCAIDTASIVCHLNTRGNFQLANIVIEDNVTLRARSRIQQAVVMESGSMLLEKSLAMTGEIVEADSIWLGNPASRLFNYDCSTASDSSPQNLGSDGYGSSPDPGEYV